MADNQPPSSRPQSRTILGLPIWAWGIGIGAFLIGVIYFFRQQSPQTSTTTQPTSGASTPVPFPTGPGTANNNPTGSQQFGSQITLVNPFGSDWPRGIAGMVPLYVNEGTPNDLSNVGTLVPPGTQVSGIGPGQFDPNSKMLWYPVLYGGQQYLAAQPNVQQPISNQFANAYSVGQTPAPVVAGGGTA